jgi:type 1 glutamine amidotransferase
MFTTGLVLAASIGLAVGPDPDDGAATGPPPLKVLIVTGVDHPAHNWKLTAPALEALLEEGGRIRAEIAWTPEALADPELVRDQDVIILHFRNEEPFEKESQIRDNLERFVKVEGKGLVLVHFACGAFPRWPGFGDLAGRVWDAVNTHDPRGPFTVNITEADHPIAKALGLERFETDDELYTGLTGDRPIDVFAAARSKVTARDHPMAFTFACGAGRVFHTPLGHDVKALTVPEVKALLRAGTLWAGGRSTSGG